MDSMAQVNVSFLLDENLKIEMEKVCDHIGLDLSTAFTLFAEEVVREQKFPFVI